MTTLTVTVVLALIVGMFVISAIRVVPQQSAYVVERLGRYQLTQTAGLLFLVPFIDRVAYKHSLKEVPMDVEPQVTITRDNSQVTIDGILYFQVTDAKLASYGTSNYMMAIVQLAKTTLRSEVGRRELDRLLEERATINGAVVAALDEASAAWGVKVLRYEVKDITPPEVVLRAMQLQLTAEREKRALIARSEGQRQEQINLAEGHKQAAIAQSEGAKQAVINKAQGDAQSIEMVATATATAIRRVADAISAPGGMEATQLKVAEQYVAAFANVAKTSTTVVVPADLGNMASLVTSAMSIVKRTSPSRLDARGSTPDEPER